MFCEQAKLKQVIDEYVAKKCANVPNWALGGVYGWPMNSWCVSNMTDVSYLFYNNRINKNISSWDVSNVTDMSHMFNYAQVGDISNFLGWDVSSVKTRYCMFHSAQAFNVNNLSGWNVSAVINMASMFYAAKFRGGMSLKLPIWLTCFLMPESSMVMIRGGMFPTMLTRLTCSIQHLHLTRISVPGLKHFHIIKQLGSLHC